MYSSKCTCPKCGKEIFIKETSDMDYDGDTIIMYMMGRCPSCETEYAVDAIFALDHLLIEEFK